MQMRDDWSNLEKADWQGIALAIADFPAIVKGPADDLLQSAGELIQEARRAESLLIQRAKILMAILDLQEALEILPKGTDSTTTPQVPPG